VGGLPPALVTARQGLSVGQAMFGLSDWYRDGTLRVFSHEAATSRASRATIDFSGGRGLPISGLTAWQGLFHHGRLHPGGARASSCRRGRRSRFGGEAARTRVWRPGLSARAAQARDAAADQS